MFDRRFSQGNRMLPSWVTTTTLAPIASKVAQQLLGAAKEPAKRKLGELKLELEIGFDKYVRAQIDRYSSVKTVLGSNMPLPLADIYINLYVAEPKGLSPHRFNSRQLKLHRDDDLIDLGFKLKRIIFTATADAGKSMLMKYLFLKILSDNNDLLPLFIELRDLNEFPDKTVSEYLLEQMQQRIHCFTRDQLIYALKEGIIVLFFDGYDEIDYDRRLDSLTRNPSVN